jgi:ketosteroid isomerase-like protein
MQADYAPAFAAGLVMHVVPSHQDIWLDDSAEAAVVTAELDYQIRIQEQDVPLKLRSTTVLLREPDSGAWKVAVEHYSRSMAYDSLFLQLVERKVQAPARVEEAIAPEAGELIARFRKDLRDFSEATLNDSAIVITPGEIARGAEAARSALRAWMGPPGNTTQSGSGIRAGMAPGGQVGWVITTAFTPIFAGPESSVAPVRVLVIYHLAGDHWEISQAHFSIGWSRLS